MSVKNLPDETLEKYRQILLKEKEQTENVIKQNL